MSLLNTQEQFAESARKIRDAEKRYILCIDLDDYYIPRINRPDYIDRVSQFLRNARKHFTIVHVWHFHDFVTTGQSLIKERGKVVPFDTALHNDKFPGANSQNDDYVLGKKHESAFEGTDLRDFIDSDAYIGVLGAYGDICVDETMVAGLAASHNMIAITDLIYSGEDTKGYRTYNGNVTDSASVLNAFGKSTLPENSTPLVRSNSSEPSWFQRLLSLDF